MVHGPWSVVQARRRGGRSLMSLASSAGLRHATWHATWHATRLAQVQVTARPRLCGCRCRGCGSWGSWVVTEHQHGRTEIRVAALGWRRWAARATYTRTCHLPLATARCVRCGACRTGEHAQAWEPGAWGPGTFGAGGMRICESSMEERAGCWLHACYGRLVALQSTASHPHTRVETSKHWTEPSEAACVMSHPPARLGVVCWIRPPTLAGPLTGPVASQ